MSETDTLARLLRACATGYGCRSAISPKGLGNLTRHGLWREAAEAILELDTIHPRSQACFLDTWMWTPFARHLDEDLAIAFLHKVLPPYLGYNTILFRGQGSGPVGKSWTVSPNVALKFALFGDRVVNWIDVSEKEGRADAVVLGAIVPAANIICAPCLHGKAEGEYIIDPRGVEFWTEPASEAAVWISEHTASILRRVNADGDRWTAKRLAAEQPGRATESNNGQRNEFRTAPTNWGDVEAALTDRPSGVAEESRPAPESNTARLLAQPVSGPDGL